VVYPKSILGSSPPGRPGEACYLLTERCLRKVHSWELALGRRGEAFHLITRKLAT